MDVKQLNELINKWEEMWEMVVRGGKWIYIQKNMTLSICRILMLFHIKLNLEIMILLRSVKLCGVSLP